MAIDLTDIQGNLLRGYRSANARHFALGIVDDSAPSNWIVGGTMTPTVHLMLSLYTDEHRVKRIDELTARLCKVFASSYLTELHVQDANALPKGKVHFGYRDGIAQPQIEGAPGR